MTSLESIDFTTMVSRVGTLIENTSTAKQTAIKLALNSAYLEAAGIRDWSELLFTDERGYRDGIDTSSSTLAASEAEAPLPWDVHHLEFMTYQDTSWPPLEIIEAKELYEIMGSQYLTTGRPKYGAIVGRTAQYTSIAASTTPKFQSPSQNANIALRIKFRRSDVSTGRYNWQDLSAADWQVATSLGHAVGTGWPIEAISIPSTWTDYVNGYLSDGTTQILSIEPTEVPDTNTNSGYMVASRPLLRVWPVPDTAYAMNIGYYRTPQRLTEDEDVPVIPVSDFMVYKAASTMLLKVGLMERAKAFEAKAYGTLSAESRLHEKQAPQVASPRRGGLMRMTGIRRRPY